MLPLIASIKFAADALHHFGARIPAGVGTESGEERQAPRVPELRIPYPLRLRRD
jgi:hypothetical protein